MPKRKKRDYLDDLDKPRLGPDRRHALLLFLYVREAKNAKAFKSSIAIDFDKEASRFKNSLNCVNCNEEIDTESGMTIYCSEYCQQVAGTVRHIRSHYPQKAANIEFQTGIGARLIHLPNGGYPARDRLVSKEIREKVFKRDGYICRICKKNQATQIDHIRGSSNSLTNLQASCATCNREKANSNSKPATSEDLQFLKDLYSSMAQRIASPHPLLACDDQKNWQKTEPKIREGRKKLVYELELKNIGISNELIDDFFSDAFEHIAAAEYLPTKYKNDVICDACKNVIGKNTLYIRHNRKRGARACIDCVVSYRDDGWEDVDGYVAHAMAKAE